MDDKYIVFKREEFEEFKDKIKGIYPEQYKAMERYALDDAVVIRRQDMFASAALHTYANSIGIAAKCIGPLAPSVSSRLLSIADYFHQQAVISDDTDTKLPD